MKQSLIVTFNYCNMSSKYYKSFDDRNAITKSSIWECERIEIRNFRSDPSDTLSACNGSNINSIGEYARAEEWHYKSWSLNVSRRLL